ncbi:MAG TPA: hypothetical protein VFR97_02455 [Capillimicrobium sp.]|nr:hypothetical protein [Capillimicrobium sp.]
MATPLWCRVAASHSREPFTLTAAFCAREVLLQVAWRLETLAVSPYLLNDGGQLDKSAGHLANRSGACRSGVTRQNVDVGACR